MIGKYTIPYIFSVWLWIPGAALDHHLPSGAIRGHGGVGTDGTAVAQRVDGTSLLDAVKMTSSCVVSGGNFAGFLVASPVF